MNWSKTSASMPGLLMACSSDGVVGEDVRRHLVGACEAGAEGGDQLVGDRLGAPAFEFRHRADRARLGKEQDFVLAHAGDLVRHVLGQVGGEIGDEWRDLVSRHLLEPLRSEEHTSELQSLMRISYAVFCLKTKKT